jgi:hypothetical protein
MIKYILLMCVFWFVTYNNIKKIISVCKHNMNFNRGLIQLQFLLVTFVLLVEARLTWCNVCVTYSRHVKHAALCKHNCGPHKG